MRINPWRGLGALPREIWMLFCATIINRAGTMALPFLVLYLTQHMGFSASRAGMAMAAYGAGALISMPTAGRLSDSVGSRRVFEWTLLLSGTFLLGLPWVHSFGGMLATTFVWGVLGEGNRPASMSMVTELVGPEQRKSAFAVIRLAANLGMTVGPAVGGLLAAYSYPTIFRVDGATSILAAIFLMFVPWRHLYDASKNHGATGDPAGSQEDSEETDLEVIPPSYPIRSALPRPNCRLALFMLAQIPVMMVFFQFSSGLPLFMTHNLHLSATVYGLLLPINTLLIIFLEVPVNIAMEHWPHRRALPLGAFLCGAGFGALILASNTWSVGATIVIWTFGEMILFPGASAYVAEIAPVDRRGSYMGLYTMSVSLAFVAGPWLGATVLAHFGPATLWTGAFIGGCVSAAMMMGIDSEVRAQGAVL